MTSPTRLSAPSGHHSGAGEGENGGTSDGDSSLGSGKLSPGWLALARARAEVLAAAGVIALVVMLLAIAWSGAATPTLLGDPGAFVRWGLPVVTVLVDLSAAVTIGALVLAAVILPFRRRTVSSATPATPDTPTANPTQNQPWLLARRTAGVAELRSAKRRSSIGSRPAGSELPASRPR